MSFVYRYTITGNENQAKLERKKTNKLEVLTASRSVRLHVRTHRLMDNPKT